MDQKLDEWGFPTKINELIGRRMDAALREEDAQLESRITQQIYDELERFLADHPTNERVWTTLGDMYCLAGAKTEELYCYHRALAINPMNVEANAALAGVIYELSRPSREAKPYLEIALSNCEGHTDEETILGIVVNVAAFLGFTDLARSATALGEQRFPGEDWSLPDQEPKRGRAKD